MASSKIILTVCITTYNRAAITIKLIKDLVYLPGVEYLVVDDGSKQEEVQQLKQFLQANAYAVHLIEKENGGKYSGLVKGLQVAQGKYFTDLDSDDAMPKACLENILKGLDEVETLNQQGHNLIGVCGLCKYVDDGIIGDSFPQSPWITNWMQMRTDHKVSGDKAEVILTHKLKEVAIPNFKGERRMPTSVLWYGLGGQKVLCVNEIFNIYDISGDDRLSNKIFRLMMASPNGSRMNYQLMILHRKAYSSNIQFLKALVFYWRYSFHGARPFVEKKVGFKLFLLLPFLLPFSFAIYCWDVFRLRK